jgi:sRNA-binding protein
MREQLQKIRPLVVAGERARRKALPSVQVKKKATDNARPSRKNRMRRRLENMMERWPQAFNLENPRPLSENIGIMIVAELVGGGTGKSALLYALGVYTSHVRYLRVLTVGGARYNLKGEPDGEVTPEQQQRAAEKLKTMKKSHFVSTDEVAL